MAPEASPAHTILRVDADEISISARALERPALIGELADAAAVLATRHAKASTGASS